MCAGDAEMGINLNLTMLPAKLKTVGYATHQIGCDSQIKYNHDSFIILWIQMVDWGFVVV